MKYGFAVMGLVLLAGCAAKPPAPPPPAPVVIAPAAVRPPPPPAPIEAPNFNAMSQQALRTRLGTPAFSRKDGATEMWRYDAGACHAYFFFTGTTVSHIETLPRASDGAPDTACLIALKKTS